MASSTFWQDLARAGEVVLDTEAARKLDEQGAAGPHKDRWGGRKALSIQEFCEALDVGETLARDLIRRGEIRSFRIRNKLLRIPTSEADRFIDSPEPDPLRIYPVGCDRRGEDPRLLGARNRWAPSPKERDFPWQTPLPSCLRLRTRRSPSSSPPKSLGQ